ncbi:MAG: SRPBCC family protein, partial [Pseudomonadota bacterium]
SQKGKPMKSERVHQAMVIDTPPHRLWEILARYGDVSSFHGGVVRSSSEPGSKAQASPGCERVCHIMDMGLNITLKERIVDYEEGKSYAYDVYEWRNFPIRQMRFGFSIENPESTRCVLHIDIEFKARPALLTPLLIPKMRKLAHDVLLGYKHYAETGEQRAPIARLRKTYGRHDHLEVQYG